jgi:transposase-like protein
VPTPSKFNSRRRAVIIELLASGHSRAAAARAAGVDPSQLSRWIAKGKAGHPEGRWRMFSDLVELAESRRQPPILVPLSAQERDWTRNPDLAWKFLQDAGELQPDPPPEPVRVEVVFASHTEKGDNSA